MYLIDVSSEDLQRARRSAKRKRCGMACFGCKLAKVRCCDYRPCSRCVKAGEENACLNGTAVLFARSIQYRSIKIYLFAFSRHRNRHLESMSLLFGAKKNKPSVFCIRLHSKINRSTLFLRSKTWMPPHVSFLSTKRILRQKQGVLGPRNKRCHPYSIPFFRASMICYPPSPALFHVFGHSDGRTSTKCTECILRQNPAFPNVSFRQKAQTLLLSKLPNKN